ncbi:RNB domain-containing ribonuclease [Kitasatospora atroaurantiaca]|uniref:Exoribonuclease R n=1 Tax=Kitasatospora atroaurantiaca TaxID=285545 RepID=A0A561EMF0_9ACTN|nr:RNB domain-containing ribonuclease [Kitasatospora atroaurantiaca]TWE16801.1 exoribonuclease R [Kitasatospora atroaurantiaca]
MPRRHLSVRAADTARINAELAELRTRLELRADWPDEVLAEADRAAGVPRLPEFDATDLPLFTLDPPGSMDLDQAMHLTRRDSGYRVHYAIADVAAFVRPGGAIDTESHRRVQTLYFPDTRIPLHPARLSEAAASLLPGELRPALLWQIDLDADGAVVLADVRRAQVRSRRRLDYEGVQGVLDAGAADEQLRLLAEIGRLREAQEQARGGVSLPIPEQEVEPVDGGYRLAYRAPRPADGWNAQISLLTGMAAADLMLDAGVGLLRTLPGAPESAYARLRRVARALEVDWPDAMPYPELIRSLDPARANNAAFLNECTGLLRGAGYHAFDTARGVLPPADPGHAALAAPYAHCTAPLRRLADRYAQEICVAIAGGADIPLWVSEALLGVPALMESGDRRAHEVERACVDLVEAELLRGREGERFDAVVIDIDERKPVNGTVQLREPAVVAKCDGTTELPLGERIRVRLTKADPATRTVRFAPV